MSADANLSILGEKLKLGEAQDLRNSDFISDITSRKYEFVKIIESLSDVLTNQDVAIRKRGVSFLTWILAEVSPDLFNHQEITAIVNFYCDRLKDHPVIASATIKGLLALVKMKNIGKESLTQLLMALFRETDCQILDKSDRYNIFSTVAYLVESHFEVVAAMGFDFVFGIISIADGETDPGNLLLLFRFFPSFLRNINLGHLMEETFDLLSCYFPIDYDTSNKNGSVTRQDLAEGLMNCLVSRSDFADLCIPLIFDKLTSTAKIAKIDSYVLLGAGCSTFSVESVIKHSNEIWKLMEKDVLPPTDYQVRDAALNALSEIVKLLTSSRSEEQPLKRFLDSIVTSVKGSFTCVENNMFRPAMDVLMAVSSKSIPAAKYVIGYIRSVVDEESVRTPHRKRIALSSLAPFLPVLKELARSNEPDLVTLFNHVSKFHINATNVDNPEVQRLALLGLQELVDDFDDTPRNELLKVVVDVVRTEWCENRNEFLKLLRQLGRIAPKEMLEFVKNMQAKMGSESEKGDVKSLVFTMSAIASEETITEYAIPELIKIITTTNYFDAGLTSLLNSIKMVDDNQFLKKIHADYNLTETLITWWIDGIAERKLSDNTSINSLSEMTARIVRCQEISIQKSIIDRFIPILLPGLESGGCESNIFLIEAILNSVEQIEGFDEFPLLGSRVVSLAVRSNDENVGISCSRLLASIVNKMSDNLPEWLSTACDEIFSSLNDTTPVSDRKRSVCVLNWIVKGLLLADSPRLESFIPKWFDLLENKDVGLKVADGFKTVLKDESLYLNTESHCNVKILYRQKFFTYFPMLMGKFESSQPPGRRNYVLALVQLIKAVPKHVAAAEITNVVIVLSQALDTGHPEAILVCTKILEDFLKDRETILVNYIYTFVPKFLELSRYYGDMKIRMSALRCLFYYAFYPTVSILPLRKEVIKSLQFCLDDKKRLVRSEAVRSRNRWFLVGAPGEDNIFS